MSKINRIEIKNLKAVSEQTADFGGCTAIIIGGNEKGKSTFLKSIPDRIRGIRPPVVVKEKEKDGKGILTLDTGEKFEWIFNSEGQDKLTFFTKEGYKSSVTKEISKRFFPPVFDIDEFLASQPKEQNKQLQKLLGIDFSAIDLEYKVAYDLRTERNKEDAGCKMKLAAFTNVPEKVEKVDVSELSKEKEKVRLKLNAIYSDNKATNENTRKKHEVACEAERDRILAQNQTEIDKNVVVTGCENSLENLIDNGYKGKEVQIFIDELKSKLLPQQTYQPLTEPTYISEMPDDTELKAIDEQIINCQTINSRAAQYEAYQEAHSNAEKAYVAAIEADKSVKEIEGRKKQMLLDAKLPSGIEMKEEGIFVDGFPLDKNQIATSKLYTTALRLASLGLGEVKTLYFDASTLDKNTLLEIETWATNEGLQLLIEKVDFEGKEISYEIVEQTI